MKNTKALEGLVGQIAAIKWNGGYDRNGSHDAGEYVDYEGVIGEVLSYDQMHAVAEWVSAQLTDAQKGLEEWKRECLFQSNASKEITKQLEDAQAQLAAERAMADRLAECILRCLSDTEYRARNGMSCTTEIEEGGIVCFPWGNGPHAKLSVVLHDYKATRQPKEGA